MYEVILHLKSGKAVNIGKMDDDRCREMTAAFKKTKYNLTYHCGNFNNFYYSFTDIEMIQIKEA